MKKLAFISILVFNIGALHSQNAVNFDGTNDLIQTNYGGILGTSNRTFEAWIYVSSSAPTSNLTIVDYGTNIAGARNTFHVTGTRALGFISGGTNANISSSPNDIQVDQWTHVAFVLNNGTGFFYVNGNQVGTGSLSSVNTPAGGNDLIVGERVSGGSIPFEGSIDEVRIWNVARSQAEIQAELNNEICQASPNLQLYLQLNQGIASGSNTGLVSVTDNSGNGYSGTMNGFSLNGATSNWVTGATLTAGMNSTLTPVSACGTYTWSANGTTYTTSGIYSETLTNVAGCDSTTTLDLTINSAADLTTNAAACDSFEWGVNGQTYFQTTTAVETLTNSQGCQYDHTLNITINSSTSSSETVETCNSYTWSANGQSYSTSGVYSATLTNAAGCDSVATLNLTISTIDNSAIDNGDLTLSATASGVSYQWLDCDNGNSAIAGATSQTYPVSSNGNYAVEVTNGVCTDTSACITVDYIGLEELSNEDIAFFPNPTQGALNIHLPSISNGKVVCLDLNGSVIQSLNYSESDVIHLELMMAPGVYFIQLISEGKMIATQRVIKK